jgi:1,2-diacylglycerol 3-alpha-glucosyltransferase
VRIGFATDAYRPYVSGVTTCVALNRQFLEEHGHEVYVFPFADPRVPSTDPRVVTSPGVRIRNTNDFRLGPRLTRKVQRLLATMDVVNVDNPFISGRFALSVCRKHGIPVVFTNHTRVDLYAAFYADFAPALVRDTYVRQYMRRFCRQVDAVISPTESMVGVLRDMGVDVPVHVVPNGVDIAPFLGVPRGFGAADRVRDALRLQMGYEPDDVVFLYTGRLGPEKNLPLLVDAFARVAYVVPGSRLLFVGGGPSRKKIAAAVSRAGLDELVAFTGMVPHERMPDYLALGDVWVTPSVTEVHPLTVIEAMAAGLPVVGVASPGITDTVEDGVTGLLADRADAGALAECMAALASHPDTRHGMATAAREASKRYSIETTGAQLLGVYDALVAQKRLDAAAPEPPGPLSGRIRRLPTLPRPGARRPRSR